MPGPQGRFVYAIGTANYPSSTGTPPNVTSTFMPSDCVYLVALMHGLPQGTHAISVVWYLNGIPLELGPSPPTIKTINGDMRVVFGL